MAFIAFWFESVAPNVFVSFATSREVRTVDVWCFTVSDEGVHDKLSKKELLGGSKRKDKKDKKDRGYATLEGESSADEEETK